VKLAAKAMRARSIPARNRDSRLRGFREAVGKFPGLKIVASQPANWERDQGSTFPKHPAAHPRSTLFACSDLMRSAPPRPSPRGKTGKIVIVASTPCRSARRHQEGVMAATVAQFSSRMARWPSNTREASRR